jgi:hypothetical protein
MKAAMKILMLVSFFIVAFVPVGTGYEWLIWLLITCMFFAVAGYYWLLYGVTETSCQAILGDERILFSGFGGRILGYSTQQELVRGRLVVTERRLVFFKRDDKQILLDWSVDTDSISGLTTHSRLLSFRSGYMVTLIDGSECRFTIFKAKSREQDLLKALGWV